MCLSTGESSRKLYIRWHCLCFHCSSLHAGPPYVDGRSHVNSSFLSQHTVLEFFFLCVCVCCGNPRYHHNYDPPKVPLFSLWEHTGTQMVKPTLVMSGKGGRWVGGLLQMAQRASPISLHERTHTHTHTRIYTEKWRGKREWGKRIGGKKDSWMYVWMEGVGGCVSPVPLGASCVVYVRWLALI